ncbi:MAG: phage tail tape measure protein [Pseudomonas sp.]|jgi:TP901 family phage tail tape measure protein|uniref:phage tail tape measure protein n=1 Tax=unclassified Pseudomonas TaxID=196821 RepID=UPI0015A0886E|nr:MULTISPECIES: phage tail tape measure protein [unclassified Pseudomonas]MDP9058312.1 phage tail tape measure protein [Pseudomonadota bacterium]DAV57845.1 MAG TPA: minor tail protein [Caudoviricetes sp.]MDE1909190.1 phage tail tape measure protein [Pseudomonas sp.]MDE2190907.1 phage tail tape measure protein [Pseudomonas sp.]MDE2555510.1 phage tail tape measure protein [Pseudomonas sp.]
MANSEYGLRSAIAKDGGAPFGSLDRAESYASINAIAPTLVTPSFLDTVPGDSAGQQISQLVAGQARLIDTLELFNASLLNLMDARQIESGNAASGAKASEVPDSGTRSQMLDAAMTDLDQLLGFAGRERKHLRETNLAMATEPVVAASGASAVDLAKVEYVAAKSGIGSERVDASGNIDRAARQVDLTQFARDSAIMATAFKIDVKNAGEIIGGWRASMKLDRGQALDLADATNVLGTSVSLNAEAADIGSVVQGQGAAAMAAGMRPEQIAALSAALLNAGNSKGATGVGVEKISAALAKGENASEAQRSAWAELKLDPKVLAGEMKQDAPQTLVTVLEALKAQPAQRQAALATQLFDGNQSILSLMPAVDSVKQAFSLVADKSTYATSAVGAQGSVVRSAELRADSTQARRQAFDASTTRLDTASDTAMAPIVNTTLTAMTALVNGVGWLAEALPKTTATVTVAAAVMGPLLSGVFDAVKDKVFDKVAGKILREGDTSPGSGSRKKGNSTNKNRQKGKGTSKNAKPSAGPTWGLSGKTAKLAKWAGPAMVMADAGFDFVKGAVTGDKQLMGSAAGSAAGGIAGQFAGAAIGQVVGAAAGGLLGTVVPVIGNGVGLVVGGAVGRYVGGALGTVIGSDIGSNISAWLGEKFSSPADRLPPPTDVSKNLSNAQADNRQINFAPQITITAPEQANYQQLAAIVVQQIEAQFRPLSMDNLLATRRDAALTDGMV